MLTLLYARAGLNVLGELLDQMKTSTAQQAILIVPDQYSHESEVALCAALGDTAYQRCATMDFNALASRLDDVCGGGARPVLDAGGRMLLMYNALRQVSERLTLYRSPARKPAFLTDLIATVDELRLNCVTPDQLRAAADTLEGRQQQKLRDLAAIYEMYTSLEPVCGADPRSVLDFAEQHLLDSRWASDKEFFVFGFTDFTIQEERVLRRLMHDAPVTVALHQDPKDPSDVFLTGRRTAGRLRRAAKEDGVPIQQITLQKQDTREPSLVFLEQHLFSETPAPPWDGPCAVTRVLAADPRAEAEWCASEIRRLLRQGDIRSRDIAVCCRKLDSEGELIESVFERYGIPVFLSAMDDVLQKPVIALVTAALAAVAEDYPYEHLFRYLKTGLTDLPEEDQDLLENYVLTWDLRGSAWTRQKRWDMHPEGYGQEFTPEQRELVAHLDEVRRQVIRPLEKLRKCRDKTGRGLARALYQLLEDIQLPERLSERAYIIEHRGMLTEAAQYRQLWEILAAGLEQCAMLLGDTELELDEFARLFTLVLSQYDVGTIPVSLDRVTVGDIPRMVHAQGIRVLFLLGADSDTLPDRTPPPGLFNDTDRNNLAKKNVPLGLRQEDLLHREMTYLYEITARPSDRLYVSYAVRSDSGEHPASFLWERLGVLFPESPLVTVSDTTPGLTALNPAMELAGQDRNLAAALEGIPHTGERLHRLHAAAVWKRGALSQRAVNTLFGKVVPMSASKLDLFNSCHFGYFLRFGLKAKPREQAKFRPTEYGTFVHAVLENTLQQARAQGIPLADTQMVAKLALEAADHYEQQTFPNLTEEPARFQWLFARMKQSALAVTDSVCKEMSVSQFEPTAFEMTFADRDYETGQPADMEPVVVQNGVTLRFTGAVDRVDTWVHDGQRYLRVVDYKTGQKAFDFADVEDGRGLQMLLYLFTLTQKAKHKFGPEPLVPAGVLYVPARNPLVNGTRTMTPEEVQEEQDKMLVRKGLVLDNQTVLNAMEDTGGAGKYRFLPINARGKSEYLVSPEQLDLLQRYVFCALEDAAGEFSAGNINADPYWREKTHNACAFCKYQSACHFEEALGDAKRVRRSLKAAEFWSSLANRMKEGDGHGN